jgi:hypothetical protein
MESLETQKVNRYHISVKTESYQKKKKVLFFFFSFFFFFFLSPMLGKIFGDIAACESALLQ